MPANYAHYRFGAQLLPKLPPEVRRTVGRFRQLYDMGQHGPDIFFYQDPLLHGSVIRIGKKCHAQTGTAFFQRVCRMVRMDYSEGAMAYLYGVLGHYALDSMSHPYVSRMVDTGAYRHNQIELEFDRRLLELDGKTPPHLYDQTAHMQLTPGECQTAAMFYPNVRSATVSGCVKNMRNVTQLLKRPQGAGRTVLRTAMDIYKRDGSDLMIPLHADPHLKEQTEALLRLFEMAQERYLNLLDQIQSHLRHKTPLGTDFSLTF